MCNDNSDSYTSHGNNNGDGNCNGNGSGNGTGNGNGNGDDGDDDGDSDDNSDGGCDYDDKGDVIVMGLEMVLVVAAVDLAVAMISMTVCRSVENNRSNYFSCIFI